MRRIAAYLSALAAAGFAASCVFVLDFDELQAGGDDAGVGGTSGSGGAAGGGGTGCPDNCDDGDPCTVDRCDASGDEPVCEHSYAGIVEDGFEQSLEYVKANRVTMTTSGDSYYVSVLGDEGEGADLRLFAFRRTGDELIEGPNLSEVGGALFGARRAISAAGMVADTRAGFTLVGYLALGDSLQNVGRVWRVGLGSDLTVKDAPRAVSLADTFRGDGEGRAHPIAWRPGDDEVYGAWTGPNGIYLHSGAGVLDGAAVPAFDAPGALETDLAPLAVGTTPAVAFTTENGAFTQALGRAARGVPRCENRTSSPFSAWASPGRFIQGLFLAGWTNFGSDFVSTEASIVFCGQGDCVPDQMPECDSDNPTDNARNARIELFRRDGDPNNVFYQVSTISTFTGTAVSPEPILLLQGLRVVFANDDVSDVQQVDTLTPQSPDLGIEVSRTALGPESSGPDWAELTVNGGDRIGLAWIEPKEGGGDVVRMRRYRVCFPPE